MKICTKCHINKSLSKFSKHSKAKDGLNWWCKKCCAENHKEWAKRNPEKEAQRRQQYYDKNKEIAKAKSRKWRLENPEYLKEYNKKYRQENAERLNERGRIYRSANKDLIKQYMAKYAEENADIIRKYKKDWTREKLKNDPIYRLNTSMRRDIGRSLRFNKKGKHWEGLVGYSLEDLKQHLEVQFRDSMTWENYGQWHIDHIIPVSLFNITSADCREFKKCWALENLQPLWALENLRKSNKILI